MPIDSTRSLFDAGQRTRMSALVASGKL